MESSRELVKIHTEVVSFHATIRRYRFQGKLLLGMGVVEIFSKDERVCTFSLEPFTLRTICGCFNLLRMDGFIRVAENLFEESVITKDVLDEIVTRPDLSSWAVPILSASFVLRAGIVFEGNRLRTLLNVNPYSNHSDVLLISSTPETLDLFSVFFLSTGIGYYNDLTNLVVVPTTEVEPYKYLGIAKTIPYIQKVFQGVNPHLAFSVLRERFSEGKE